MPDLKRIPVKHNCKGVDLEHTVDEIPEGFYAQLRNVRALQQGQIQARPGTSGVATTGQADVHTVKRLNNLLPGASPTWALFAGNGTKLSSGQSGLLSDIATGFSGNPLSAVSFRPDVSPEAWMYFGDSNKMVKANTAGTVRNVGITPPQSEPTTEYGPYAAVGVADGTSAVGWGFSGATTAVATADRTRGDGATLTIASIAYNSGSTGWCCINPSFVPQQWYGERMLVLLGGTEACVVREIHQPITSTTIAGISYDSGSTGACSIVLTAPPDGCARNSLIQIVGGGGTEVVRVLAVVLSPDGTTYSIRCVTVNNHAAGATVNGKLSWYVYTRANHAAGEAITSTYLKGTQPAAGIGAIAAKVVENAGLTWNNRPVSIADDYLHVSLFFAAPQQIAQVTLLLDIDPDTAAGTAFSNNCIVWELSQAELGDFNSSSANVWVDVTLPLAQGKRMGNNPALNLTTVNAVGVALESYAACDYGFDYWYNFGTYGPDSGLQNPTGAYWRYRYRDTRTGAKSVPSPAPYYGLYPLREEVVVTVAASSDAQVNEIDVERIGAGTDSYTYIASAGSNANTTVNDVYSAAEIAGNPSLETDVFPPFLVEDLPWSGTVNVVGTSVTWSSGTTFSTNLAPGTVIIIGGVTAQVAAMPTSSTRLTTTKDLGVLTGAAYSVASPALMGQPLQTLFGPLEGPTASFVFGIGDPRNPGLLYWTNGNNPDGQGQSNFIEITPPSEPLKCGVVWGSVVFVASERRVFLVQPSYTSSGNLFVQTQLTAASGCHSPWGMAAGVDGVYMLGRDGIYLLTQGGANYLSKALWPLWPHEGKPAQTTNDYLPVDMTQEEYLKVEYADSSVYFTFKDTGGALQTWRMAGEGLEAVFSGDPAEFRRGWFWEQYNPAVRTHYFEEVGDDATPRLLKGTVSSSIVAADSTTTDSGNAIACLWRTGSNDLGDPRTQKLYMDLMQELSGTGTLTLGFNRWAMTTTPVSITSATRGFVYTNIATLSPTSLVLYPDIAVQMEFAPGAVFYEYQPSFYLQPFYGYELTTQLLTCQLPGWKQLRYRRLAVVSTSAVTFTVVNDEGTVIVSQSIASTGGVLYVDFGQLPNAAKGRLLRFSLTSDVPFAAFPEDIFVRIKKWGGKDFVELRPFVDG